MKNMFLKIILISSFFYMINFGCDTVPDLKSNFLDNKSCTYHLSYLKDSLILEYHLVFDTLTFELAGLDSTRFTLFQSAYFAWYVNYISYRVIQEYQDFDNITVYWKSNALLDKTLFTISNTRKNLLNKFEDTLHLAFVEYMIDSIDIEDYFIYNKILSDLYEIYKDPRLTWNFAYLLNQFEINQCGHDEEHVSFEVFLLLSLGVENSKFDEEKKEKLVNHIRYIVKYCFPQPNSLPDEFFTFDKLNLYN